MLYNESASLIVKGKHMIHRIFIYRSQSLDPYFNIATEKHLLDSVREGECILYLWQNQNTVVIGRNQNAWAECRTSLLEQEGGKLARRLSGGGAVFHDLGNLNFTFLVSEQDYNLDRQLKVIQTACAAVGIQAERSGRNDLLVDGQKFSGNAFFHSLGHAYHHGTLLVSADMDKLSRYLTPSKAKLDAKGVASVRSRVANLQGFYPGLTCQQLSGLMEDAFSQVYGLTPELIFLSDDALQSIQAYAAELQSWQWLYGPRLPFSFRCEARFPWGGIELQLQVESGYIRSAQVYSDAMDWAFADAVVEGLTDCRFALKDMCGALATHVSDPQICEDICQMLKQQEL